MKDKKILIMVIIVVFVGICIFAGFRIFDRNLDALPKNKVIKNTNSGVIENKVVKGIEFSEVSLNSENGNALYKGKITNKISDSIYIRSIEIIVKNSYGLEIVSLNCNVGRKIGSNESTNIEAMTTMDLPNDVAFSLEYIINK